MKEVWVLIKPFSEKAVDVALVELADCLRSTYQAQTQSPAHVSQAWGDTLDPQYSGDGSRWIRNSRSPSAAQWVWGPPDLHYTVSQNKTYNRRNYNSKARQGHSSGRYQWGLRWWRQPFQCGPSPPREPGHRVGVQRQNICLKYWRKVR